MPPNAIPLEAWIRTYRDGGLTPADAKTKVTAAVMAVALDRDQPRPELLEALLDSTQEDGKTPSLNAAEQLQVQDRLTQARNLAEAVVPRVVPAGSLLRRVAQDEDPVIRDVRSFTDMILAGVPTMSESIAARRDFMGRPLIRPEGQRGALSAAAYTG